MNTIINGFHDLSQLDILNKLLDTNNLNYIFHISSDKTKINSSHKRMIDNNYFYDIGSGNYDFTGFDPLDIKIIEEMTPYESIVIKMMDRLELYSSKGYSKYKKRYDLYLRHLRYWSNIIKDKDINLFINQSVPHEVYDYIIYALCKIKNIPTLFFFQSQMHDTSIILSEIDNFGKNIKPEYESLIKKSKLATPDQRIILSNNANKEWLLRKEDIPPFYMNEKVTYPLKIFSGNKNRFKKLLNPLKVISFIYFLIRKKIKNIILDLSYVFYCSQPDLSKKFVYFPLHLQPELTTCPLGGATDDQRVAIEMIAKSLPDNIFLYIKENPKQEYFCRNSNYYREMLKYNKKIVFVSKNLSTYELIDKAIVVATFTGTAGWEALFKKKPVLVFGNCFYDTAPGVFKINSHQDCLSAVQKIINGEFIYNENNLKLFLQAVSNVSLGCCTDPAYFCQSSMSIEENNDIFFKFLDNYIKNIN